MSWLFSQEGLNFWSPVYMNAHNFLSFFSLSRSSSLSLSLPPSLLFLSPSPSFYFFVLLLYIILFRLYYVIICISLPAMIEFLIQSREPRFCRHLLCIFSISASYISFTFAYLRMAFSFTKLWFISLGLFSSVELMFQKIFSCLTNYSERMYWCEVPQSQVKLSIYCHLH